MSTMMELHNANFFMPEVLLIDRTGSNLSRIINGKIRRALNLLIPSNETILLHQNPRTGQTDPIRLKNGGWNYVSSLAAKNYVVILDHQQENIDMLKEIELLLPTKNDYATVLVHRDDVGAEVWKSHQYLNYVFTTCQVNLWTADVDSIIRKVINQMYGGKSIFSGTEEWKNP